MHQFFKSILGIFEPFRDTFIWPGLQQVGEFLGTHLLSGMIPAFFIAGAIGVFLDNQRITKLMGSKANPFIAYPVAALSGGLLTVCSCGVLPIFTGIMQQGAGIGPAFTFLMASPAVNLIALTYTYTLLGTKFMIWRAGLVFFSSIFIGLGMKMLCKEQPAEETQNIVIMEDEDERTDGQLLTFFIILIFIMITSTGVFDPLIAKAVKSNSPSKLLLPRIGIIIFEIIILSIVCKKWFYKSEIILWLRKSKSLFFLIFPKVLGGIFLCGLLTIVFNLPKYIKIFSVNDFQGNFIASIIGSIMYFGTIVGVTIVTTMRDYGMHPGPAMTLLLSAPAVSLPSILALVPIAGAKKSAIFLLLVVLFSALSGFIFGSTF